MLLPIETVQVASGFTEVKEAKKLVRRRTSYVDDRFSQADAEIGETSRYLTKAATPQQAVRF